MESNSSYEKLNRRSSTTNGRDIVHDAEDIQIPVPWGHISGKWWGPKDEQPIICLHGWQDNAGSFDSIAPLLSSKKALLAIDLPGHGFSSHYPDGVFYYVFWDGLILLRRVVKHYKWDKITILGHSLGGAIGFLYAAAYPDEVDALISIDIATPSARDPTRTVGASGDHIDRFLKYENLTPDNVPCYEYEEMINIVEDGYKGSITRRSAEILMIRGMQPAPTPGRHYFSRDPRLKTSMLGMLSMDLVLSYASQIKCSYLNIRAVPGLKFDNPENYGKVLDKIKETSRRFEYREVEGSHHVHLNEPEKVAPIIEEFFKNKEK
ncbi:probable serine hydrolase isoform X1 [Venturia canescens]|uniref:probable serine hydrolase isoform X1 n=1 Tax=Venturia canescens TaxID=32260 RepID=UPI001C9C25BC|nr:probable serine hydrolase isoform X1 [Venturia canescens]